MRTHPILVTAVVALGLALAAGGGLAAALQLAPFKDELFAYPPLLSSDDGGAYRVIDYREARDIDQRDEIPERRVRRKYISTGVRRVQTDVSAGTAPGIVRHVAVGKRDGARLIAVYLHGQGGSRKQGVDDFTFGGNFNRIKNLMAHNGGLYLSPDFSDFGEKGAAEIAALVEFYLAKSPRAKLFLACGSMGGHLCWALSRDPSLAGVLAGVLLLGSVEDARFFSSAAFKAKVPVFLGHGSRDPVFPIERQEEFFRSIRAKAPGYPAKFVRFETGTHGTPIRMTDWRETLNWMLAAR